VCWKSWWSGSGSLRFGERKNPGCGRRRRSRREGFDAIVFLTEGFLRRWDVVLLRAGLRRSRCRGFGFSFFLTRRKIWEGLMK
jgi:hypothetical protein